jgi:drug/metabolite transporter (DMT)-like permease
VSRFPAPLLPAIAAISWGAMFPIADGAFSHVDPFNITAIRYVGASIIFLAILVAVEGRDALRLEGRGRELLVLGSLGFAGFNLLAYVGLSHTEPQNAAIIVPTMPLATVIVRWARDGIKPSAGLVGAITVALVGVVLVVSHGDPSQLRGGIGDALVLLGVFCWVVYTLGAARFAGWSPLRYTALSAPLGTVTVLAATAVADAGGWQHLPSGADVVATLPAIFFIIVFGAVVAVLSWNLGVRKLGPANASLFITLVPVTTFAIRIGQGYVPGSAELIGTGLVLAALVGGNLAARRAAVQTLPAPVRDTSSVTLAT